MSIRPRLVGRDGREATVERLTLLDQVAPPAHLANDPRVAALTGDVTDAALLAQALPADTDSVFHLAAVVSAGAEEDFDLGMAVNLDATRTILEIARGHGTYPRLVFASSCAAFGGDMPDVIQDMTAPTPQTSYGTQKVIGELLVNDYSRKGFVDGRSLRFPTVVVRPGKPNKAASTFASSVIREPLQGQEAVCPVAPETAMWLASPRTIVANTRRAHDLPAEAWGPWRAVALPGFTTTVGAMVEALAAVAGVMVTLYYGVVDFYLGFLAGLKAFTAAVLGGIGSLPGAMLGGVLIGLIEALWAGYFSSEWKDVAAFSILVLVLIFRPQGLLGRPEVEKV